ncbi:MAG: hypothetical protein ACI4P8_02955 [Akkermansia sp.]
MKTLLASLSALFVLLLVSCQYEILASTGTPALQRSSVDRTMEAYRAHPPRTENEMINLLQHKPQGVYRKGKFKYSYWGWYEINPANQYFSALAACISENGKIQRSAIKRPTIWGTEQVYGDASIFDFEQHPEMKRASLPFFRKQCECEAAQQKRKLYMSPSGMSSYLLGTNETFLGWDGENPRVAKQTAQPSSAKQNAAVNAQVGEAVLNSLVTALATKNAVVVPEAPTDPAIIERNRRKNQELIDYWKRKEQEAKERYEYWHDVHYSKGGFSTW